MNEQELLIVLRSVKALVNEAEHFFEISAFDDAENCCNQILHLLESLIDDSITVATPESPEYKIIAEVAYTYNRLNTISLARGDYDIAEQQAKRALELSTRINDKRRIAMLLGNQGLAYSYRGDYERALEYYHQALAVHDSIQNKLSMARMLTNIGSAYFSLAQLDSALSYYLKAIALFDELGKQLESAVVLSNIGIIYQKRGELLQALELFEKGLRVSIEFGSQSFEAKFHSQIGEHYHIIADYASAINHYELATQLHEKLGEKPGLITDLQRIALVYRDIANLEKAIEYFELAEKESELVGLIPSILNARSQLARIFIQLSDFQRAQECVHQCFEILDRTSNPLIHSHCLETLGIIAHRLGNVGEAERYYLQALEFRQPDEDSSEELCSLLLNLGVLNREKGEYDKAKSYFMNALETAEKRGERASLRDAYRELSTLLAQVHDFEQAYEFHTQFHHLFVLLQSQEAKNRIAHFDYNRQNAEREKQLAIERTRHEITKQLLHNVLPPSIAQRMVEGENLIAEKLSHVTVLFADIVNFTELSQTITAEELVQGLDRIFSEFDALAEKYNLEKIKTIGDAYMVVAGAPQPRPDHNMVMTQMAVDMLHAMKKFTSIATGEQIHIRIGIHSGEVVAGVIGKKKFVYDLWGDAVNTASRMESYGVAGKIHVSEDFVRQLSMGSGQLSKDNGQSIIDNSVFTINNSPFTLNLSSLTIDNYQLSIIPRGEIEIKGKGMMRTYFLERV